MTIFFDNSFWFYTISFFRIDWLLIQPNLLILRVQFPPKLKIIGSFLLLKKRLIIKSKSLHTSLTETKFLNCLPSELILIKLFTTACLQKIIYN